MSRDAKSSSSLSYVVLLTLALQTSGGAALAIGAGGGAAGGALTSGVAYLGTLGETGPAQSIWTASVDGDYIVTPRMIEGHDDVDFVRG